MLPEVTSPSLAFFLWALLGAASGQTLSNLTFSPPTAIDGSNVTIKVQLIAPFTPAWSLTWQINEENVASVLLNPVTHNFLVTLENSSYAARVSARIAEPEFNENRNLTAILVIQTREEDNSHRVVANLRTPLNFPRSSQVTGRLNVDRRTCPASFTTELEVAHNSSLPGSLGTFNCTRGGYPFLRNGSASESLQTECTNQGTWLGYDNFRCLFAPNVKINFFSSSIPSGFALICNQACINPTYPCSVAFYIGDEVRLRNSSFYFLQSVNTSWVGRSISCQELSPYTRRFNTTGRSESVTIERFQIPSPIETTCFLYENLSQVCDVVFEASPSLEFVLLLKNDTSVDDASYILFVNGSTHVYRIYIKEVSTNDYGSYELIVRFSLYPGLNYAIEFNIEPRPPPMFLTSCAWFLNDVGTCVIPLPSGAELLSLTHNGSLLSNGSYTTDSGDFRMSVLQASSSDSGVYSLVYKLPNNLDEVIRFKVFVRPYPFNAGLVIGIAFAAMVVIVVLLMLCCRYSRRKADPEQAETAKNTQKNFPGRTSVANTAF